MEMGFLAVLILVNILPALQNHHPSEVQSAGPTVGENSRAFVSE
jgi:hypothetical protein